MFEDVFRIKVAPMFEDVFRIPVRIELDWTPDQIQRFKDLMIQGSGKLVAQCMREVMSDAPAIVPGIVPAKVE
jgi:hypothetical protein